MGENEIIQLKPDGANTQVTSANRIEYIHLIADYKLNRQIRNQCAAFKTGFTSLIDLEYIRSVPDAEEIAARFFSCQENAVFRALPPEQKQAAFFNCWTRKEAYIKAIGDGLAFSLDQFDVSLSPGEPARLLGIKGSSAAAAHWSLQELTPAPGYVAALAVEGHGWSLICWQWPE